MKKIINKIKRYKIIGILMLCMLFTILGITIGKYINTEADSTYQFQSNEINFDGSNIGLSATNVKDAVDQIYQLYQSNAGKCPDGYNCLTDTELNNYFSKKILRAYTYNESSCLSGNESGCVKTTCYTSTTSNSCPVGTIIDYAVNNSTLVRFHVLHDDGTTMTMQAQKNTVYNTKWYTINSNTNGPQTIMTALKSATDGWTNVNNITITSSTTSFTGVSNIDNSCSGYNSCSGNKYNMSTIAGTYKARLITLQEAYNNGGCRESQKSCKAFMNNYLTSATSYCGESSSLCENDTHTENGGSDNYGYWTLGTSSSDASFAWYVCYYGRMDYYYYFTSYTNYGARAVVNVTK